MNPTAREEGEHEQRRDHALGVLRVPRASAARRENAGSVGLGGDVDRLRGGGRSSDDPARACRLLRRLTHELLLSDSALRWSRRLAVSHMAMSTRKPRPPSQPSRPSVTVPVRPSEKPPGLASFRVAIDVGDDVPLLGGRDRPVAEDRHGLGAGQHRLVDLGGRRRVQRRRDLAVGQRAARAGEAVALGAVRAEQLRAERRVGAGRRDLLRRRDRRAAAERGDVGGDVVDLRLA